MALQNTANILVSDSDTGLLIDTNVAYSTSVPTTAKAAKPMVLNTSSGIPGTPKTYTVIGGANVGMNAVTVTVMNGVPNVSPTEIEGTIPDAEYYGTWDGTPRQSGLHLFESTTGNVLHGIGGHIFGLQSTVAKSFPRVCSVIRHSSNLTDELDWENSTQYTTLEDKQLDMWQATMATIEDPLDSSARKVFIAGSKTFAAEDWENGVFDKIYYMKEGATPQSNMAFEAAITITDPEAVKALGQMMGGSAVVLNNVVYMCTHGLYTSAVDSQEYSGCIVAFDLSQKTVSTVLAPRVDKFLAYKRFVLSGTTAELGTGDAEGKVRFKGALSPDGTELRNVVVTFDPSNSTFVVNSSNMQAGANIKIPLQMFEAVYDTPLNVFDDYYELTGTPGTTNIGLILGGLVF